MLITNVCKCVCVECFSDVFSSQRNAGLLCKSTLVWKNSDFFKKISIKNMAVNIYVQDCVEHKTRQSYSLNQLFKPKILTFMGLSG